MARDFDVESAIALFEYFGSLVEVLPSQARDYGPVFDVTTLEPYGVIAGSRDSRDRSATGGWTVRITDVNERGRIRHV
jgi:hypothetical protein